MIEFVRASGTAYGKPAAVTAQGHPLQEMTAKTTAELLKPVGAALVGDGAEGLFAPAPYDAIVLAVATPRISVEHDGWLDEGTELTPARFVPMLGTDSPGGPG